jgi:exoribonuclease-2
LRAIAVNQMRLHGLAPDFPAAALAEVDSLRAAPAASHASIRDLRDRLWCSIDNVDSRDLDQLSVAEPLPNGNVKILVAIADVDVIVFHGSAVDRHAAVNTTSVYTPAAIFPMLPEKLSTDLTSLALQQDRLSIVVEFVVSSVDGTIETSDVYGATVRNKAKLAYTGVDAWLTGKGPLPPPAAAVSGLNTQLQVQDQVAQRLSRLRHEHGALDFETPDTQIAFDGDAVRDVRSEPPNRAKALIENLMVAANGVVARFLTAQGVPSIRRVVREPARWDRIVRLAAQVGAELPQTPDIGALADFLGARKSADPAGFADLSQTIVKLLGPGVYVVDQPNRHPSGHFGLAVKDYTHATAPNRRYPDLLTQRLVKGALARRPSPYTVDQLDRLAEHCTQQENEANKVERQVRKAAAALVVLSRIEERFDAIVTGASEKGTWVRVAVPPLEGKLVSGERGLDVGDRVSVRLTHVDVEKGYIDFRQ